MSNTSRPLALGTVCNKKKSSPNKHPCCAVNFCFPFSVPKSLKNVTFFGGGRGVCQWGRGTGVRGGGKGGKRQSLSYWFFYIYFFSSQPPSFPLISHWICHRHLIQNAKNVLTRIRQLFWWGWGSEGWRYGYGAKAVNGQTLSHWFLWGVNFPLTSS